MPLQTKDEIINNYSRILGVYSMKKEAADVVDYSNAIAGTIAAELAGAAAFAAIPAAITAAKAGTSAGLLANILARLGIFGVSSAAVSSAGVVAALGGPIGIALGLAGLAYAIYEVTKLTDDNVDDLISRLEDLDPKNDEYKAVIEDWITNLKSFKPALAMPLTTTDPVARAEANKARLNGVSKVIAYLKSMQQDWPSLQAGLTDWGWDPSQAKNALDKTISVIEAQLQQLIVAGKEEAKKLLSELEKETKISYQKIAQSIVQLYSQLTTKFGIDGVKFETAEEQAGYDLALAISKGDFTIENLNAHGSHMIALEAQMQQALGSAQQAPAKPKKSSFDRYYISKRALLVGGKRFKAPGAGVAGKGPAKDRNPDVTKLQKALNNLRAINLPDEELIAEDGVYGPKTSKLLFLLLEKDKSLSDWIARRTSRTPKDLQNYQAVAQDVETLSALSDAVSMIAAQRAQQSPRQEQSQQTERQPQAGVYDGVRCPLNKSKLTTEEIEACLMDMQLNVEGKSVIARNWLHQNGYLTPAARADVVRSAFESNVSGMPIPADWLFRGPNLIQQVVGDRRGRQWGPGQFGGRNNEIADSEPK